MSTGTGPHDLANAGGIRPVDPLAVLGVAETAAMALCEQQLRASLGQMASVDAIRAAVEANVYWAQFTAAVGRGEINERHPDLPRKANCGPLGELLVLWARQAVHPQQQRRDRDG